MTQRDGFRPRSFRLVVLLASLVMFLVAVSPASAHPATVSADPISPARLAPAATSSLSRTNPHGSTVTALPWLHASMGTPYGRLQEPDGSYFPLRGVDVNGFIQYGADWNESVPLTLADFEEMHSLGLDFIRLSFSWSLLEPTPGAFNVTYLDQIEQAVGWAGQEDIYVLLDMHQDLYNRALAPNGTEQDGFPAWTALTGNASTTCPSVSNETVCLLDPAVEAAWNAFWNDSTVPGAGTLWADYQGAWTYVAAAFANISTVAGYDLMNEPATGVQTSSLSPGYCPNGTWEWEYQWEDCFLLPFYQSLIHAIRTVDPRHAIFFEPSVYTDGLNWAPWNPVSLGDSNVVYAPHVYTNVFGPTANWSGNASAIGSAYSNAALNAGEFGGVPWFVGEYGTNPDHWHDSWIEANLNFAGEYAVGTDLWEWKDAINVSTETEPGGSWGLVAVNGSLRNDTARAEILASPHPIGAGEGADMGPSNFNFTTATYQATVENGRAGGWTTFYVASFWYPSGFTIGGTYTALSVQNVTYDLPGFGPMVVSEVNASYTGTGNFTVDITPASTAGGWLAGNVSPATARVTVTGNTVPVTNGNFTLLLPPGSTAVTASAPGYVSQSLSATIVAGQVTRIRLVLPQDAALEGWLTPRNASLTLNGSAVPVGTAGNFTWRGVGGTYRATASLRDYVTQSTVLDLTDGRTTWWNTTLVPLNGWIDGRVSPSAPNVTVWVGTKALTVGSNGSFNVSLPPGSYLVRATATGYLAWQANTTVQPGTGTTVDILLRSAPPVQYTVTYVESGLPPGTPWSVKLGGAANNTTSSTATFRDPNGTFAFEVTAPSGYRASPSSGTVVVQGKDLPSIAVAFSKTTTNAPLLGSPTGTGYVVVAVLVAIAVIAAILWVRRRKKGERSTEEQENKDAGPDAPTDSAPPVSTES